MKNIIFLFLLVILVSCEDDIYPVEENGILPEQEQIVETPPEGLKLKNKYGLISVEYFYNSNGFVDSLVSTDNWLGDYSTKKYIYNEINQIIERRYTEVIPNDPQYNKKEITYYTYNTANQIISSLTYDKNNVAIGYKTYNYNSDGTLFDTSKKVVNGNVVQEGSTKYQFDTFRNPYYNIYPKAYRILNFVNKNNILVTEYYSGTDIYTNIHTLEYNSDNYIISEYISNMPLDTDDRRGFDYY
ncbi:hypothetical protein NU10_07905 [Flavobacterium dauae]|uniref:hypothetical protein n=1 Tax=Flavobacterium dauae TaxID=1563479 RepID=UPI00101B3AA9|nr:hypothetical protein [Flavobacterium dauae]WLD22660.1 hypothetical protein NU10_07905 [Flavobacterium dauae]